MDPIDLSKLKRELRGISQFLGLAAVYAAEAYGTTKWMARPLVDRHFTPGNVARYGWKPLAASTVFARAALSDFNAMARMKGRQGSKGEKMEGRKQRVTPAMVQSGDLRNAMSTTGRATKSGADTATLRFTIPDYGKFHLPGGATIPGKPPTRDFLAPNREDVDAIRQILQQRLDALRGRPSRAPALRPGAPP
jgi:phage gpG-like protein